MGPFAVSGTPARRVLAHRMGRDQDRSHRSPDSGEPCWKSASLAYFDTSASNGSTEAINGVIETTRRVVRGFRNFTYWRLRCPLAAGGYRPYRRKQTQPCLNAKGRFDVLLRCG